MSTFKEYINRETETINDFIESSSDKIKLRKILNESYSRYDFTFCVKNKIYLTEVKTRNVSSTAYSDTILEKNKIDEIQKLADEYNNCGITDFTIKVAFLVKFSDDTIYLFDIDKCPNRESIKKCPSTSALDGNNFYKSKRVRHFQLQDGLKIK